MPYALIAALITSFSIGFATSYKIEHGQVVAMETAIEAQKLNAQAILKSTTDLIKTSEAKAIESNINLDKAHEQFIQTANAYDKQLDSIRLYPKRGNGCTNSLPKSDRTRVIKEQTSESKYAEKFDRVIKQQARIADEAANYAEQCYQFVVEHNCGISK